MIEQNIRQPYYLEIYSNYIFFFFFKAAIALLKNNTLRRDD